MRISHIPILALVTFLLPTLQLFAAQVNERGRQGRPDYFRPACSIVASVESDTEFSAVQRPISSTPASPFAEIESRELTKVRAWLESLDQSRGEFEKKNGQLGVISIVNTRGRA